MRRIVIAGGGIAGLATALRLAHSGHEATVAERNDFTEFGAGIQLAPNGINALNHLNIHVKAGVHIDELRFMDGVTGEHVVSMPVTGEYARRFGNPYVVVHRGDLYGQLLTACRAQKRITLRAHTTVTGYAQDDRTASARTDDGEITGDALIGADGIHSAIRAQLVGDGPPRLSGITVYRALIPMDLVPADLRWSAVTWWAGPKCHFVHYPVAGGEFLNLAASNDNGATTALSGVPVAESFVLDEMSALGGTARRLLALGRDWKSWVLVDRDPVARWTDGRVALLGDAAHPMLHYAAQGACQALEDALVLGDRLDREPVTRALLSYNAARRDRTARIQRLSRQSIDLWHPAGDAATARNALLSAMSATDLHDEVAWLHSAQAA